MRGLRATWGGVSTSPSPEVGWWERTGLRDWGRQPGGGGCRWVTTLRSPRDPRSASADGLIFGRARIFSEGLPETLGRPRHRAPPLQRHLVAAAGPWAPGFLRPASPRQSRGAAKEAKPRLVVLSLLSSLLRVPPPPARAACLLNSLTEDTLGLSRVLKKLLRAKLLSTWS